MRSTVIAARTGIAELIILLGECKADLEYLEINEHYTIFHDAFNTKLPSSYLLRAHYHSVEQNIREAYYLRRNIGSQALIPYNSSVDILLLRPKIQQDYLYQLQYCTDDIQRLDILNNLIQYFRPRMVAYYQVLLNDFLKAGLTFTLLPVRKDTIGEAKRLYAILERFYNFSHTVSAYLRPFTHFCHPNRLQNGGSKHAV